MPRSSRFSISTLVAAALCACAPAPLQAQQLPPARLAAAVDSIVQTAVLAHGVTGVSLIITRGGETLLERSWGMADVEARRPADASTTYRLGSITKQFTAALVLKQVDRGTLALTDTIGRYLTGLRPEWTGLTIEQLLNHTSGLPRDFRNQSRIGENLPADSMIAMAVRSSAPSKTPGSVFIYSNTGYMLLGALVEKLYGKSYGAALRDEIARPLGLSNLGWCGDMTSDARATGYQRAPNGSTMPVPFMHPSITLGSGGICSTAGDIARWNRALHGGKVLKAATYTAMTTPHGVAATRNYALGLYVRATRGGDRVIVHDGSTLGYSGENVWYPADSLSLTMLYNTSPSLGADLNLTEDMGRIVLNRAAPAPTPAGAP